MDEIFCAFFYLKKIKFHFTVHRRLNGNNPFISVWFYLEDYINGYMWRFN